MQGGPPEPPAKAPPILTPSIQDSVVMGGVVQQQAVYIPQGSTITSPLGQLTATTAVPFSITVGQIAALAVISLTALTIAAGGMAGICCLPLGLLFSFPGALYAKQKKDDYFMIIGAYPPTHPLTWAALIACIIICIASLVIPFL